MSKSDYQKFILTEIVALIQRKYKFEVTSFFFDRKNEIVIYKPTNFQLQVYTPQEVEIYKVVFVLNFLYFKITRKLY